ncbi:MAG: hypothetical protein ACRDNK_04250 [Solirubrobacteraceae bacterium]
MGLLKPEGSLTLGVATAGLVYGVYAISVPNTAQMHATQPNDINIEAGRKKAAWTSAAVVAAVSLMARDKTIFVLGGMILIALDWHARHANAVSPDTGQLVDTNGYVPAQTSVPMTDQAPAYGTE